MTTYISIAKQDTIIINMDNNNNNINNGGIKTYRHEFSKEFMAELSAFSKVHQYDDRHAYKSEWAKWTQQEVIAQAIDVEKRRLQENGYIGDIDDKMFKAGRYYFRKKTAVTAVTEDVVADDNNEDEEEEPQVKDGKKQQGGRRPYITMSKAAIRMMDEHITNRQTAAAAAAAGTVFKPSSCYDDFYQTKMSSPEMTKEIEAIIEKYEKNANTPVSPDEMTNEIIDKIKKTYKNRYYKYVSRSPPA
jgi:hypothetical protein